MAAALLTLLLCATPVPFPGFGNIGKGEDATTVLRKLRPQRGPLVTYVTVTSRCCGSNCGIKRTMRRHLQSFRTCYEHHGLRRRFPARGTVDLRFRLARTGSVRAAWVARTTLGDLATERCLLRTMMRLRFRAVGEDPCCRGIREIRYPLRFTPVRKRFWVRVGG